MGGGGSESAPMIHSSRLINQRLKGSDEFMRQHQMYKLSRLFSTFCLFLTLSQAEELSIRADNSTRENLSESVLWKHIRHIFVFFKDEVDVNLSLTVKTPEPAQQEHNPTYRYV